MNIQFQREDIPEYLSAYIADEDCEDFIALCLAVKFDMIANFDDIRVMTDFDVERDNFGELQYVTVNGKHYNEFECYEIGFGQIKDNLYISVDGIVCKNDDGSKVFCLDKRSCWYRLKHRLEVGLALTTLRQHGYSDDMTLEQIDRDYTEGVHREEENGAEEMSTF